MKIVPGMESNYHFVLWYQNERTILVKHTEFPYSFPSDVASAKWVYLSSLAPNSLEYHKEIHAYLEKNPETKLAFQPGTFQIKLGVEELKAIYERTEIFFCNVTEAERILNKKDEDKISLIKDLKNLGPKIVIMTDGVRGAYCYDGERVLFIPVYSSESSYESTGAGDSFASAIVGALLLGKPLEEALLWGPINAMSVVSFVGAQKGLLTREKIEEYIANAKEDYKVTILE
jgi:sugar/nucleoside kinase (ribokinase family)